LGNNRRGYRTRTTPAWVMDRAKVRPVLTSAVPRMYENSEAGRRQREYPGRWAAVINLYFPIEIHINAGRCPRAEDRRGCSTSFCRLPATLFHHGKRPGHLYFFGSPKPFPATRRIRPRKAPVRYADLPEE